MGFGGGFDSGGNGGTPGTSTVTSAIIVDGSVAEADLANGSVTNTKIADGAVTSAKLAADIAIAKLALLTDPAVTAAGVNSQATATLLTKQISYVTAGSQLDPAGVRLPPSRPAGETWVVFNAISSPSPTQIGIAVWPSVGETIVPNAINVRDFLQAHMVGYYTSLGSGLWRATNAPMKTDHVNIVASGGWNFYQLVNMLSGLTISGGALTAGTTSLGNTTITGVLRETTGSITAAAAGTQAAATQITAARTIVTSGGGTHSVKLPASPTVGDEYWLFSTVYDGTFKVFPSTGDTIVDSGPTPNNFFLATGVNVCVCISAGLWHCSALNGVTTGGAPVFTRGFNVILATPGGNAIALGNGTLLLSTGADLAWNHNGSIGIVGGSATALAIGTLLNFDTLTPSLDSSADFRTKLANHNLVSLGGATRQWKELHARRLHSTGTALVVGDFSASAGWGTGASVSAVSGDDAHGTVTVTSGTTPSVDPTVTLTFKDGTWTDAPSCFAKLILPEDSLMTPVLESTTATTMVLKFKGTPLASTAYQLKFFNYGV
jgi:hypothetical protein